MFQKTFSFCGALVIALAAVLSTVTPSQAFPRGGGFHGGFRGGGFRGGFPRGGFHHFPRSGFHHGVFGRPFGPGPRIFNPRFRRFDRFEDRFERRFHQGFFPFGGFSPGYSGGSYPSYSYPSYSANPYDNPYSSANPDYDDRGYGEIAPSVDSPATAPSDSSPAQTDTTVHITVKVPADAQLWFGGSNMTSRGSVRIFQSPPLKPGRYTYVIRAHWKESGRDITQVQTVIASPGDRLQVDFPIRSGTD